MYALTYPCTGDKKLHKIITFFFSANVSTILLIKWGLGPDPSGKSAGEEDKDDNFSEFLRVGAETKEELADGSSSLQEKELTRRDTVREARETPNFEASNRPSRGRKGEDFRWSFEGIGLEYISLSMASLSEV